MFLLLVLNAVVLAAPEGLRPAGDADPSTVQVGPRSLGLVDGIERFAYDGATVPEGFELRRKYRATFLIGGAALFLGSYGATVAIQGAWLRDWSSLVPIAGPVIGLVRFLERPRAPSIAAAVFDPLLDAVALVGAAVGTLAQVAGVGLVVVELARPMQWLERTAPRVLLVPSAAGSVVGLSLIGQF
jgi:hypothetical protein